MKWSIAFNQKEQKFIVINNKSFYTFKPYPAAPYRLIAKVTACHYKEPHLQISNKQTDVQTKDIINIRMMQ